MIKAALCVNKADVWGVGIVPNTVHSFKWNDDLFYLAPKMVPRSECETDPSLLQLIPYVVIQDHEFRFFCYERGNSGGEDRLKSKLSIGIGGHIDSLPPPNVSLYQHALLEAAREIQEETGLVVDPYSELTDYFFLYEEVTEVGKVHFGLVYGYQMTKEERISNPEKEVITNGKFLTLQELFAPDIYNRLELWSKMVVDSTAAAQSGNQEK